MIGLESMFSLLIISVEEGTNLSWNWLRFWEVFMGALAGSLITFFAMIWKMKKDREEEFERWFRKEYIEGALDQIIENFLNWSILYSSKLGRIPEIENIPILAARKLDQLLNTKAFSVYFIFIKYIFQEIKSSLINKDLELFQLIKYPSLKFYSPGIEKQLKNIRDLLIKSEFKSYKDLDKIALKFTNISEVIKKFEENVYKNCNEIINKFIEEDIYKKYLNDGLLTEEFLNGVKKGLKKWYEIT